MTSILEVEQLDTLSSNASSTITIGGDNTTTIAFGPNVTTTPSSLAMTPAFEAYLGSDQTISDNTATKVQCGTKVYDTDSAYDNTTNYRFTVPSGKAGKYFFYGGIKGQSDTGNTITFMNTYIYLNGSQARRLEWYHSGTGLTIIGVGINQVLNLSVGDYVELFGQVDVTSGTPRFDAGGTGGATYFGGYRIIGA
jgi:hypothetical protein